MSIENGVVDDDNLVIRGQPNVHLDAINALLSQPRKGRQRVEPRAVTIPGSRLLRAVTKDLHLPRVHLLLAAVAVTGLTACGTTVSGVGNSTTGGTSSLSVPTAAAGGGGNVPVNGSPAQGTAGAPLSTGGATAPQSSGSVPSPVAGACCARPGAVADHAPIEVGIGVDGNDGPFAAAFGVSNTQPAETPVAQAIVHYLNKTGGLAGHPIKPVFAVFDNTSNDWIAQDQAMCAKFTQDNRVSVVVRTDDIFGPLDACLAQSHTPLVLWESVFRPRSWWDAAPGLRFTPDVATGARIYAALVDRMVATHHWTSTTRIGLVRYDRNDQAEVQSQGVLPALAAHHLRLADYEAVHTPESFQDLGTTSSALASAILRMRQKGVTDVMFMGGDIAYLFAQEAMSQSYYPKYALTSYDFPYMLPTSVLAGAYGIGWQPSDDLTAHYPVTAAMKRCERAAAGTGVSWTATGADRYWLTCNQLFFLQSAYDAAGSVAPGALATGARVAGALPSSFTFGTDLSKHPDGLAAVRDLMFAGDCSCLRYGVLHPLD